MNAESTRNLPVGRGRIGYKVSNYFPVSASKLWEAIIRGEQMEQFFVDKVEGDFSRALTPVFYTWKSCGRHALWPTVFHEEKKLEFRWANGTSHYLTTVTMTLRKKPRYIELEICDRGWKPADIENAFLCCNGWSMFLDYLKAYLLHGIDLRTVKAGTTSRRVAA
jgi:uncharacterized protein YndB with AHSA1/START domain